MIREMKTRIAISTIALLLCGIIIGQEGTGEERRAQLESRKVAYCTERADLTAEESAEYWALKNELDSKKKEIKKSAPRKKDIDLDTMSDDELRTAIKKRLEQHIKAEQLEYDYLDKLIDTVGAKKYSLIQKAEKEFKKEVLKRISDRRQGKGDRERGPRSPKP